MKVKKVLTRIYVNDMERPLAFYEELFGITCERRFKFIEVGLELAQVGDVLLLAGSDESLQPFRDTKMTLLVDSLDDFLVHLMKSGCEMVSEPRNVPTGRNMTVRHPDGTVVEYVEHSKHQ